MSAPTLRSAARASKDADALAAGGHDADDARLQPWRAAWPEALAAWSAHTLMREPKLLRSAHDARAVGMEEGIAAIRLADATILVNLERVDALGLHGCEQAILAHEIGHHILAPGNMANHIRLHAVLERSVGSVAPRCAALVANLWADSLINDRLMRRGAADVGEVYRRLEHPPVAASSGRPDAGADDVADGANDDAPGGDTVWCVYARSLELLWRQPKGSYVAASRVDDRMHADALLLSRIVRTFANAWILGGRRYAAVLYHWLQHDAQAAGSSRIGQRRFYRVGLGDTESAAQRSDGEQDELPAGLIAVDPDEDAPLEGNIDGSSNLDGESKTDGDAGDRRTDALGRNPPLGGGGQGGNLRTPFELGQVLRNLGMKLDADQLRLRYYKELALPHLVPFPSTRRAPEADPLPEGLDVWSAGDDMNKLDVLQSVLQSPVLVPGVTTVRRRYGRDEGANPGRQPMDLDIYVDCSGSMPDPRSNLSYLTLAATILCLSCLRAGGRVQATIWSGAGVFRTTEAFLRDERAVLGLVTDFVSGATAFPLHVLRDTYARRKPSQGKAHVVVISDDGIDTMLDNDEHGTSGEVIVREALRRAEGGGTLVLNLFRAFETYPWSPRMTALGLRAHVVRDWAELLAFARAYARTTWGDDQAAAPSAGGRDAARRAAGNFGEWDDD